MIFLYFVMPVKIFPGRHNPQHPGLLSRDIDNVMIYSKMKEESADYLSNLMRAISMARNSRARMINSFQRGVPCLICLIS